MLLKEIKIKNFFLKIITIHVNVIILKWYLKNIPCLRPTVAKSSQLLLKIKYKI